MKFTPKIALALLLTFAFFTANAQWLKKLESSDNLYRDAKREIDLKHYQAAINMCNKAIDISPKNLDVHVLLGHAYSLAGKIDSARLELNYVIDKNPKYRDAYIYLVNMEAVACNYLQALEYADMGLKYFPNDRDLLLKKLDIYNKEGDWMESNKLADYLFDHYSTDSYIRSVYLDYKLTLARQYSHRGYIEISKRAYEEVLEQDPLNKEALQAVYGLDIRSGNYESSLAFTNRALQSNPNSYEFLMKKVSILDAMSRYVEAIEVLDHLMKQYPGNPEVNKLNVYLRMEAGRYYMNTDPYLQFIAVLDKEPANRDALYYVINIAFSRGLLGEALSWVNVALKHYPGDRELLGKKEGILEQMKNYGQASEIAEKIWRESPTQANKDHFLELRTLSAKQYLNDQQYDSATVALNSVLFYDHTDMVATNYLINAYVAQKRYDDALRVIDDALIYHPGDQQLLFKKAGILESYEHYAEAALISKQLLQDYPDTRQYLVSFVEQSLEASRQSLKYDDYYGTAAILREVLIRQPENLDALNYMINIQSAFKQYDSAQYYVDMALHYYPDSKDLLIKKSSLYADAKEYREAYAISGRLHDQFPYNVRFRNAYEDQLIGSGRNYLAENRPDSALTEFYKALAVNPNDTIPLMYTINTLNELKQYDTALVLINRGRQLYPGMPYFLQKRAVIYENMGRYDEAWHSADTLSKMSSLDPKFLDYANYLYSRRLRNEIGLAYLHSKIINFDNTYSVNSIATVQYSRFHPRGTITGRINYAGRAIGTGFQFEAETYYNHTPRWYSFAVLGYSPSNFIFPTIRAGYSIFHSFKNGYDGELGIRYLKVTGGTIDTPNFFAGTIYGGNVISGVASISKEINDFYLNLRGYYIDFRRDINPAIYYSGILTARYYLSDRRTNFFTAVAGYGTAPDDFSLNYDLTHLLAYNTVSVSAGYQCRIQYRTTLGVYGSWYNERIRPEIYRNQYDIYVILLRRF